MCIFTLFVQYLCHHQLEYMVCAKNKIQTLLGWTIIKKIYIIYNMEIWNHDLYQHMYCTFHDMSYEIPKCGQNVP